MVLPSIRILLAGLLFGTSTIYSSLQPVPANPPNQVVLSACALPKKLSPQLWEELHVDEYIKNYPQGKTTSVQEFARQNRASNFHCGIGEKCNVGELCYPVRGLAWYTLFAIQEFNLFMNSMHQAVGTTMDLIRFITASLVMDLVKPPRKPSHKREIVVDTFYFLSAITLSLSFGLFIGAGALAVDAAWTSVAELASFFGVFATVGTTSLTIDSMIREATQDHPETVFDYNAFVTRGSELCKDRGVNGARDGTNHLSFCGTDGVMMNIVIAHGDKIEDEIYNAKSIAFKYRITTEYLTTKSWECQTEHGMEFDPYERSALPMDPDSVCLVNLPVCDCTAPVEYFLKTLPRGCVWISIPVTEIIVIGVFAQNWVLYRCCAICYSQNSTAAQKPKPKAVPGPCGLRHRFLSLQTNYFSLQPLGNCKPPIKYLRLDLYQQNIYHDYPHPSSVFLLFPSHFPFPSPPPCQPRSNLCLVSNSPLLPAVSRFASDPSHITTLSSALHPEKNRKKEFPSVAKLLDDLSFHDDTHPDFLIRSSRFKSSPLVHRSPLLEHPTLCMHSSFKVKPSSLAGARTTRLDASFTCNQLSTHPSRPDPIPILLQGSSESTPFSVPSPSGSELSSVSSTVTPTESRKRPYACEDDDEHDSYESDETPNSALGFRINWQSSLNQTQTDSDRVIARPSRTWLKRTVDEPTGGYLADGSEPGNGLVGLIVPRTIEIHQVDKRRSEFAF